MNKRGKGCVEDKRIQKLKLIYESMANLIANHIPQKRYNSLDFQCKIY